jgi:hypothetical protein
MQANQTGQQTPVMLFDVEWSFLRGFNSLVFSLFRLPFFPHPIVILSTRDHLQYTYF